jgi:hypothetical protein
MEASAVLCYRFLEMDDTTPKAHRGRFQKGQSGNPSGRRPIPPDIKAAFEAHLPEAIAVLGRALKGKDQKLRVMAAVHIAERVLGKPMQNLNAKVEGADFAAAHLEALRILGGPAVGTADDDDPPEASH